MKKRQCSFKATSALGFGVKAAETIYLKLVSTEVNLRLGLCAYPFTLNSQTSTVNCALGHSKQMLHLITASHYQMSQEAIISGLVKIIVFI